jgi:hypothetical protein
VSCPADALAPACAGWPRCRLVETTNSVVADLLRVQVVRTSWTPCSPRDVHAPLWRESALAHVRGVGAWALVEISSTFRICGEFCASRWGARNKALLRARVGIKASSWCCPRALHSLEATLHVGRPPRPPRLLATARSESLWQWMPRTRPGAREDLANVVRDVSGTERRWYRTRPASRRRLEGGFQSTHGVVGVVAKATKKCSAS